MPKKTELEDVKTVSVDASKSNKKVTNKVVTKEDKPVKVLEEKSKKGDKKATEPVAEVVEEKPKKGGKKAAEPIVEVVEDKPKKGGKKVAEPVVEVVEEKPKKGGKKVAEPVVEVVEDKSKKGGKKVAEPVVEVVEEKPKKGGKKATEAVVEVVEEKSKKVGKKIVEPVKVEEDKTKQIKVVKPEEDIDDEKYIQMKKDFGILVKQIETHNNLAEELSKQRNIVSANIAKYLRDKEGTNVENILESTTKLKITKVESNTKNENNSDSDSSDSDDDSDDDDSDESTDDEATPAEPLKKGKPTIKFNSTGKKTNVVEDSDSD